MEYNQVIMVFTLGLLIGVAIGVLIAGIQTHECISTLSSCISALDVIGGNL